MSDQLPVRLARASRHLDPGFDEAALQRGLNTLEQRVRTRRRASRAAFVLATAAALTFLGLRWRAHESPPPTAASDEPRILTTHDGSVATARDPESVLSLQHDGAAEVALELSRGRGHFEVTKNPQRRYRVHAGPVEIEVLGTAFDVELAAERVRVAVDHGVVRVGWSGGSATLHAGESGSYPPPPAAEPAPARAAAPAPAPAAEARAQKPAPREQWRALARAGKHQEAFGSLGQQPVEDLAGLLLAADAARLSGHPREGVRYLEHLIDRYPESPSAPLAAFTLGRLALYELKQPALAARSFGRAYALDPRGPMAEDALAREAEAYHQAGDAQRSQTAAQRYLDRFPHGARRDELARYAEP